MGCQAEGRKRKEHVNKGIGLKDGPKKERKSAYPLSKRGKEAKKGPWETELFFVIDWPGKIGHVTVTNRDRNLASFIAAITLSLPTFAWFLAVQSLVL